ncbi:Pr6Pr family membrane protein [Serinicoccus kebangsaanensis]|uniref:Pr6Pr family membrane protein n=1 Tax=Serinicoccus kebangsaanensis TaxID=2602069 RepID=UPI001EE2C077|nr:Pr6Pr family membrane protein [Serinicoccus kebangsaanensis]
MIRSAEWRTTWAVVRLVAAGLILAAVVAQARVTIGGAAAAGRDLGLTTVNFFSFFTILSNVGSVVVLAWAGMWLLRSGGDNSRREPPALAVALACVTAYMLVTGVVYNTLLRGIELPQGTTVAWSNEVLHVVGPVLLLLDLTLAPLRRGLPWRAVGTILVVPIVWVVYTLVRGPLVPNPVTGADFWYPYPFLNPNNPDLVPQGYAGVSVYVVGIALVIGAVASGVVAVGRARAGSVRRATAVHT